ncbi:MAG: methionyl-tRNA formyltransferase [Planctomycetota bacterium]|jgi:methionyl-tRNA formyltransferase|nr:methionyl-tRNA formyltransferase [Planctomycetota bacterium]MDP6940930.1 methionyl-tRNA formyltransferase [Planctomycetota bacterium]
MRTIFAGSPPFAVESFAALLGRREPPIALVTAPPRRAGRGRKEAQNPLVAMAAKAAVPVFRPQKASDPKFLDELSQLKPDICLVVSFGQLLREEFLNLPRLGCLNLHASLLPRWRGASPIQAAIQAGDSETGVCIQKMVLALDAGDVLAERKIAISERETAPQLFAKASAVGAELLKEFLDELCGNSLPEGRKQDKGLVTVCKKILPDHGKVDWTKPAQEIDRLVRAMAGWPCGRTTLPNGEELKIWEAEPVEGRGQPGEVLASDSKLIVACGANALLLGKVQRQGKSAMLAEEFLRGIKIARGDYLGKDKHED